MADKKENELTSANNFKWVRALDSNGNSIRISKSDLVSVLEGLINPYKIINRFYATDDNLSNATEVGIYELGQPDSGYTGPNDHGTLFVTKTLLGSLVQTMISIRGKIFIRFRSGSSGIWSDWVQISGIKYE